MSHPTTPDLPKLRTAVERELGRPLTEDEASLAESLANDKTPALIAREIEAAPVADPKKIRPEHADTGNE